VDLQNSTSDQQASSMTWLCGQAGFTITAESDDTTTTLLTLASEHALRTFAVPVTAGASSSTCSRASRWCRVKIDERRHGDAEERKGDVRCPCLGVSDGVGGDRGGDVEDAVAAGDGRRHGAVVQHVGPEQPQPLRGAAQRRQVRVLGAACARIAIRHMHSSRLQILLSS
jgi:hypothetical protein